MLIALCSDKGSPGVTTTSLAIGSAWPTPCVLAEVDLAGGDLTLRLRTHGDALPEAPTLLTVAATARTHREPDAVLHYAHALNARVAVVPAPIGHEQLQGVQDWRPMVDALEASEAPILADLGRISTRTPVWDIASRADLVVLVGRPDPAAVIRMRDRAIRLATELSAARGAPIRIFPLLVTPRRHGPGLVRDLLALLNDTPAGPFLAGAGFVALDPAAVRRLEAGEEPDGRLARTDLLRSSNAVAEVICEAAGPRSQPATADLAGGRHA
jgi:hypothetical protein